jgi:radical SAM protein with 4Fe4S-binding SPASM domain
MRFEEIKIYNVDLTMTDDCNMSCTYCFERGNFNSKKFEDVSIFIKRIHELLDSPFFKNNYHLLNIGFWGGEPTLNLDAITEISNHFSDDSRVKYFLFSNGYRIEHIKSLLLLYKDTYLIGNHPKFCTQISYDGMPVHDITRPSKSKKLTSSIVRNNIIWLAQNSIPYTIKSTITPETFKYLPQAYSDILDLWEIDKTSKHFKNDRFFPTIDYYNLDKYTESEFERSKEELKTALVKLSNLDIEYFKKYNDFFFSWFRPNKALCSAGRDLVSIGIDGIVYKCHGCIYEENRDKHIVTTLQNEMFVHDLEQSYMMHNHNFNFIPDECNNCISTFCLKCNVIKFNNSKKENYLDKWRDYSVQKRLCEFYQLNGKFVMAINQIIR